MWVTQSGLLLPPPPVTLYARLKIVVDKSRFTGLRRVAHRECKCNARQVVAAAGSRLFTLAETPTKFFQDV